VAENDKVKNIELQGEARHKALEKFYAKLKAWGVALPPATPLVLDFGLGAFEKTGLIECWIANEIEVGYCGKYLFVFDGQTCPMHHHRDKHETFFVVQGQVSMTIEGRTEILKAGAVKVMDVHTKHSFTGQGDALLLEISKPCIVADNYFENRSIPIGGNY